MATALLFVTANISLTQRLAEAEGAKGSPEFTLLARVEDEVEAIRLTAEFLPDGVVLDSDLPNCDTLSLSRQILVLHPDAAIIVLSDDNHPRKLVHSLAAGAVGCLPGKPSNSELRDCLRTIRQNRIYISPHLIPAREPAGPPPSPEVLTPREREVLSLLANGATTHRIAMTLCISDKTVETHRGHIMRKLNIHTIAGLTKFAIRNGMTTIDI